jgi:hypothetical protein
MKTYKVLKDVEMGTDYIPFYYRIGERISLDENNQQTNDLIKNGFIIKSGYCDFTMDTKCTTNCKKCKWDDKNKIEKLFNEIVDFSEVYDLEDYSFTDDEEKEKELLEFLLLLRKKNYTIAMDIVKGKYQPKIYYKGNLRFIIYTNYCYQDSYSALVESIYVIIKDIKNK